MNEEIMACLESLDAIVMEHHDGKFSIYVDGHSIDQMTADELADPKNKARLIMAATEKPASVTTDAAKDQSK